MSKTQHKRTLLHTGSEVGSDNVTRKANNPNAASGTPVIEWSVPRKFDQIHLRGGEHQTRLIARYKQTATISDADASGTLEESERTVTMNGDVQAVAGEPKVSQQPYQCVVAYNTTQGAEIAAENLTVNYTTDDVTIASDATLAAGDSVAFFPLITEGTIQYHAHDQIGHDRGSLETWGVPVHVFSDFNTFKQDTRVHLPGAADFAEQEKLVLYLNSPRQIVWQDADYPGEFASSIRQDVNVELKG